MSPTKPNKLSIYPYIVASLLALAYVPPFEAKGDISLLAFAVKIAPILYLILYVNSYLDSTDQVNFSNKGTERDKLLKQRHHLAFGVVCGLAFSAVGDVILLARHQSELVFLSGSVAFALAQICYIRAMGFQHTRISHGIGLYCVAGLLSFFILRNAPLALKVVLSVYGFLLLTSFWRAMDRMHLKDGRSRRQKQLLALGFATFLASDLTIGYSAFLNPANQLGAMQIILLTYYAAQGLISVSVT